MNKLKIVISILFVFAFYHLQAQSVPFERSGQAVVIHTHSGNLTLEVFNPNTIRVTKYPTSSPPEKTSLSVIASPEKTDFKVSALNEEVVLSTTAVKLKIDLNSAAITYYDLNGKVLLKEAHTDMMFKPVVDGGLKTFAIKQQFSPDKVEALYGLGQFQDGTMNYRGHTVTLKNTNRYVANPFLLSTKGYGILWDNYSKTIFKDDQKGMYFDSEIGDLVDYYFVYGKTPDGVIAGYRNLTGQAPMYGKWAFGFWQSRERYINENDLLQVAEKYRALNIPIDNIVQDWQYWGTDNHDWNSTEFSNLTFPDPAMLVEKLHRNNIHLMISVWPSFGQRTTIYKELEKKGFLYPFKSWPEDGGVKVYDAFNPKARDLYWEYMNKNIFSKGVDAWWLDAVEPEQSDTKAADSAKTFLGSFKRFGNAFSLQTNKGVYEHQRKETSDKRVFILTRSAFSGQQRYASSTWSGDIDGNWDVFRKQISAGLNFSMAGIPYWTTDIGGFFTSKDYPLGNADPAYQELYVRWFQFGAFCPLFRSHGTNTPREIYQFGSKGDWAFDVQADFLRLRYQLMPYIYSLSRKVTANAYTIMRGLPMDFPADTNVYKINNQYMFGPSLLVNPVTAPLYSKAPAVKGGKSSMDFSVTKNVKLYLPKGIWYNFWTGEKITGGQHISCQAPISQLPLFVKAGSIIPIGPDVQFAAENNTKPITLRIYPGKDADFELYEDENDNYNYEKGMFSTIKFHWNDKEKTLTIDKREGAYPGMLANRLFQMELISKNSGTGIKTSNTAIKKINYSGSRVLVHAN